MFKVITIVAFLTAQLSLPLQAFAAEPVVNEFEKSANEVERKVAEEKEAKEKAEQKRRLHNEIKKDTLVLAARMNELETLAENIPNVREDVIEDTARALNKTESQRNREDTAKVSAAVAVASGIVYALTKFDIARAWAQGKASQTKTAAANVKVKSSPVNRGLRAVYGNSTLAKGSASVGILATLVAGGAYLSSKRLSPSERSTIASLEKAYLSRLVSGGDAQFLTDDQIEDALEKYNEDPEFRDAVLEEVRTIIAETQQLTSDINAKKDLISELE